MAGKKASLTLRLELRAIQPPSNGKYVFTGICDAEGVVYMVCSSHLRRSRSHKHHLPREKRFCGAKHWRSVNAPQKVKLSEGSRADCVAIERTSEAKCPQGAARSLFDNLRS